MEARALHRWRVSYREAVAIQESLQEQLRIEPLAHSVHLVAGTDVAYSRASHRVYAAVVLVRLPSLEVVDAAEWFGRAAFPYIPWLLTFREVPPLLEALRRLRTESDALLFDGQRLAHPRQFGLACHGGLLFEKPVAGCAKTRLVGEHGKVGSERGASVVLTYRGTTVGAVLRTRRGIKPTYVSPGHLVDVPSAVALVLAVHGALSNPRAD